MKMGGTTYIRMRSDLLDDVVIEMSRVSQVVSSNVVGMLQPFIDDSWKLKARSLAKLDLRILGLEMKVLDPSMVIFRGFFSHMVFEDNDVGVGDLLRIRSREDRGGIL